MNNKRCVRCICFMLLLLLCAQPLTAVAMAADAQEFVDATYAFVGAAKNVPPETVIEATPGALETAKALGAITLSDAQALAVAYSGGNKGLSELERRISSLRDYPGKLVAGDDGVMRVIMQDYVEWLLSSTNGTGRETTSMPNGKIKKTAKSLIDDKIYEAIYDSYASAKSYKQLSTVPVPTLTKILLDTTSRMKINQQGYLTGTGLSNTGTFFFCGRGSDDPRCR